jgi:tetratricopeptide (TPR) repeat protein
MPSARSPLAQAKLASSLTEAVQRHKRGELEPAERLYREVLAIDGGNFDSLRLLGLIAAQTGRNDEAAELLSRAVAAKSDFAETHNHLGVVLQRLGRTAEAAEALTRATMLKPDYPEALNNLGVALRDLGRLEEAVAAYERAVSANTAYAEARYNLGIALWDLGRSEAAIATFEAATRLKPDYAKAWVNLGVALQEMGRTTDAIAALRRALDLDPGLTRAWHTLSELKIFTPGDADIARMQAQVAVAQDVDDRIFLGFALAKATLDTGDADDAFERFDEANRLKRGTIDFDIHEAARELAAIADVFDPEILERHAECGEPSDLPVFVIGMPRSGTTLVEQILASHPKAAGAGELGVVQSIVESLGKAWPGGVASMGGDTFARLGRGYLDMVSEKADGRARLVDKMPNNFRYLGLIRLMLPNARIIHCRRDPMDTGVSCYTKLFTGRQDFAYDLRELGLYHRAYAQLMDHWRGTLPQDRFIEVDYEAVVADLETEARRLVTFCGLDWDPACLDFHRTERAVRTASTAQVRKPIYGASVGRWRAWAAHLGPLIQALNG